MTNLDIIKHLATNNPTRLAELLDDIYTIGWNSGSFAAYTNGERFSLDEFDDFDKWINQDASKAGIYYNSELEEWSKLIKKENSNV